MLVLVLLLGVTAELVIREDLRRLGAGGSNKRGSIPHNKASLDSIAF